MSESLTIALLLMCELYRMNLPVSHTGSSEVTKVKVYIKQVQYSTVWCSSAASVHL